MLGKLYRAAISRNMSKYTYLHSTPNDVDIYIEEFDKRTKAEAEIAFERMKYSAWLSGLYVQNAVASVMSKRAKYPKKPYGEEDSNTIVCTEDMTEEEKQLAAEMLFQNLQEMQNSFERSKANG